jgi:8-oxo-dGTP diphosphatase
MAFVKKNRPEWQAGLLNGIGGKVEENEVPDYAMIREFGEETGAVVREWRHLATMTYPGECIIWFYTARVTPAVLDGLYTATDEAIEVHSIEYIGLYPHLFIPNLHWLVPLALHPEEYISVQVTGKPVNSSIINERVSQ